MSAAPRKVSGRPPAGEAAKSSVKARRDRGRLLLVDDDEAMTRSMSRFLSASYHVEIASNGAEALERLDGGERFDLVISDLMMPHVSGDALYRECLERHPALAASMIFVTGGAFSPEARALLDQVPNARFDKPVEPKALLAAIRERLKK